MASLPTTNPRPNRISTTDIEYHTTYVEFEKNKYAQVFKNWDNDKQTFLVEYDMVTVTEKNTLVAFFKARYGKFEAFTFYNHVDSTYYNVRFAEDKLSIEHVNAYFFNISFYLKEV